MGADQPSASENRAIFLAEVGRVLAQSLDYRVTLASVAQLAVPTLADYCVVEIADEDGVLRPVAVTHIDPTRASAVAALHQRFPDDPSAAYGGAGVLRTGKAELVTDVLDTVTRRAASDPEHLALVRAIALISSMIVPLTVRGQVTGVLTLGAVAGTTSGRGRHFTEADLLHASDVARRAAVAIENARLHEDLRAANAVLEDQQLELEMQQVKLEEQAAEMQAQSEELQGLSYELELRAEQLSARNADLERANIALASAAAVAEAATAVAEAARRSADSAQRDAEEANAAKNQFLANMSHELRTPLNAIAGYVQLLEIGIEGPLTDGQHEYIARLGRAQRHLLTLINDVLSFAKLEVGQTQFRSEDVPVAKLMARLEELVRPQLDAKAIRYTSPATMEDGDAPMLVLVGDLDRTLQVLVNLVGNAIKFTPHGGAVTVSAVCEDGVVRISVADTGSGIADDQLDAIFDPFVQVSASGGAASTGVVHHGETGAGLGLTISRHLARRMGGDLTVESVLGSGSTFTVSLPAGKGGRVGAGSVR